MKIKEITVNFNWKNMKKHKSSKKFILYGCMNKEEEKEKKYLLEYMVKNILVTHIFLTPYLWKIITQRKAERL